MPGSVRIEALTSSRSDRARFTDVEFLLNRRHPLWVPPLRRDRMKELDPEINPFFQHAEAAHYVASRDGRDVGRIAAIRNRRHEEIHDESVGFFGFFESEDDPETATALLDAAAAWVGERGLTAVRGPFSYDVNGLVGALVGPFDLPPVILMPWNPEYVPRLIEGAGFRKVRDVVSFDLPTTVAPERVARVAARVRKREGIEVRTLDKRRFADEVRLVKDLYNRAWEKNWGFVPLTEAEIDHVAADLRRVLDPEMVFFATAGDRTVGFALALPDVNIALRRVRSGRLTPWNLVRLLLGLRKVDYDRVFTLGVVPEYRNRGIEALFYHRLFQRATAKGHRGAECGWVLEDNEAMIRGIGACGGTESKRYRVYERPTGPEPAESS